jgi:hypothetical protein
MNIQPPYDSPLFIELSEIHFALEAVSYLLQQRACHDDQGEHVIALLAPLNRRLGECLERWENISVTVTEKEREP